jgi:hypothetical protein
MKIVTLIVSLIVFVCCMGMLLGCSTDTFISSDGGDPGDVQVESSVMDGEVDGGAADVIDSSIIDAGVDGFDGYVQPYRRVFITSVTHLPTFGSLAAGDTICASAAFGAALGGSWKAWLSSSSTSASSRLEHAAVPYELLDGTILAANWTELVSGSLRHPIDRDEHDTLVPWSSTSGAYSGMAWTGTLGDGSYAGGQSTASSCADWTSGSANGVIGGPLDLDGGPVGSNWTQFFATICSQVASLYCFEQP